MENKSYKLKGSKNCNYCLIMSFRIEDTKTIKTPPKQIKHVKLNNNNKNIIDNTDNLERSIYNNNSVDFSACSETLLIYYGNQKNN